MKISDLLSRLDGRLLFTISELKDLYDTGVSGDSNELRYLKQNLYRWRRQGKIIALRRGHYAVDPALSGRNLDPLSVAVKLYKPSYVSLCSALDFHGVLDPQCMSLYREKFGYTSSTIVSATIQKTNCFENSLGSFRYHHIQEERFCGWNYYSTGSGTAAVAIAEPHKALLDLWHLFPGRWGMDAYRKLRFDPGPIDTDLLHKTLRKTGFAWSLDKALFYWCRYVSEC